jgi:hypothetical protein
VVNTQSERKGSDAIDLASGKLVDLPKEPDKWSPQQQSKWAADSGSVLAACKHAG